MRHSVLRGLAALILSSAVISGCTEAPEASVGAGLLPAIVAIQPTFPAALLRSSAATDALAQAFDRVDRFRMIVRRLSGEIVVDIIITVTPGQESHSLSAEVPMQQASEQFIIDLIAMVGSTELFRSEGIAVQAVAGGVTETAGAGDAELQYVGPGATASVVTVSPITIVIGPGASTRLTATVFDDTGNSLPGVPLGWESDAPSVASVTDGTVTAVGNGRARIVATTPTGLQAGADLYVVDGEIAFTRDGTIFRGSVSSSAATPVASGTQPTFSPDGSELFYSAGGRVIRVGGSTLAGGLWPAVSPDGTKIAFERAGKIQIANIDGTRLSQGPAGFGPQWASSGDAFLVDSGGVERVDADGSNRSSVVSGPTGRPAVGGGLLAYIANGTLFVASEDGSGAVEIMGDVSGRPALSPDGTWVIGTTDAGLMIAPANGSGPALPLLHGEASHPAWKGVGNLMAPPQVAITGLNPTNPGIGTEVEIQGSGFDVIIPGNNSVSFTTATAGSSSADGPAQAVVETPITSVSRTGIRTMVPEGIIPGPITVRNFSSSASFEFDPPLGTINVSVMTTSGHPVEGAAVTLTDSNGGARTLSSDAAGLASFSQLPPSEYTTAVVAPEGFSLASVPGAETISFGQTLTLEALLRAEVLRIEIDPATPALEVGTVTEVTVKAFDGLGNRVTDPSSIRWQALAPERALFVGGGLTGRLLGVLPSPAPGANDVSFKVTVEGVSTEFSATVSTFIGGFARDGAGAPFPDVPVTLRSGAGATLGSQNTGPDGGYHFGGLFPGSYKVSITPPPGFIAAPPAFDWTLDEMTTAGIGDFVLALPQAFTLIPETVERLPGGTQQFTPDGAPGPFDWSVNGIVGGSSTFGTIDASGFYTAPAAVPTPATFPVCAAVKGNPRVFACADVTINPVPTAGEDVVVFNDVNVFGSPMRSGGDANNMLMARNLVNFTSSGARTNGTRVWMDYGRSARDGGTSRTSSFRNIMSGEGFTVDVVHTADGTSTNADFTNLPSDLKVIFLWTPQVFYTVAEINSLKAFAVEGGRIVYVGEWDGFLTQNGIDVENKFLTDMGAEMRNIGQAVDCGFNTLAGNIVQHQVTAGMTGITLACASVIVPGPNDFALFYDRSGTKVLAGVAKIDPTPISAPAPASIILNRPGVPVDAEFKFDAAGRPIGGGGN
jgi:Carboxypeptidase regulatory-like domain/WD40-like Beta Propeller Repeat